MGWLCTASATIDICSRDWLLFFTFLLVTFSFNISIYLSLRKIKCPTFPITSPKFSAMCVILCIEILLSSVAEWNTEVALKAQESEENWDYSAGKRNGVAVYMARAVWMIYVAAALVFAVGSRKQKVCFLQQFYYNFYLNHY